ncbi:MAG: D-cysteine desulfhydrase family protein [Pseudomonadota bacterium]
MATAARTAAELRRALAAFPGVGLSRLPTPLEPLDRLSEYLAGPRIWAKRDDLTGLGLGGNKLRKLDVVLRAALDGGADTLVSGGVVQSNSQRLVAAAAAKLGFDCHLAVYHGRVEATSAEYEYSGNALLNNLFGATLHDVPWTGDRNAAIAELSEALKGEGRCPYLVPYGVSNGLGALGYASTIVEIAEQAREQGFAPSAIVHCTGSGGTQAGLIVGGSLGLPEADVVGVDIDAEPERVRDDVLRLSDEAAALLGADVDGARVEVVPGHAGPAYGVPHDATLDAMALAGRLEALVLDPVYTGKALAGLIALVAEGRWAKGEHVVFIHTGGTPAVFAYGDLLKEKTRRRSQS